MYRNKGTCGFEIYVQDKDGTYPVVTLTSNPEGTDGLSRYTVSPMSGKLTLKPDVFGSVEGKKAGQLWYTRAGRMYFHFYIRPLAGNIRPGDDLVLRLCLKDDPTVVGAASAERLATYDKKLLWRANLYVKDTSDGGRDWNDTHRWVAGNEWNRTESGATGDGGQVIDIAEFTNWPDNARVSGSVCYSWGNEDTPFEFNQHMEVQSALIADGRSGGEGDAFYLGRAFAELKWEAGATIAPGSCWDNYVFPGRQSSTNSDACQYYDYSVENEGFLQHTYHANPFLELSTYQA